MLSGRTGLEAVRSAVRVSVVDITSGRKSASKPGQHAVVTISRLTGTFAEGVARSVVELLNKRDPGPQPWLEYDRKLVERVAEDHDLSEDLVNRLSERDKSWFEHFTAGLTGAATGTDVAMRTSQTIRGLARVGRAVIVGRGGQCILVGAPHAIHVRLTAPLSWRVERYAEKLGLDKRQAEQTVKQSDNERAKFVKNHFGRDIADPDLYHLVLNMAVVADDQAAEIIAHTVRLLGKH